MGHICELLTAGGKGGLSMCNTNGDGQRQFGPNISEMNGAKAAVLGESGVTRGPICAPVLVTWPRERPRSSAPSFVEGGGINPGKTVMPSISTVRDADGIDRANSKGLDVKCGSVGVLSGEDDDSDGLVSVFAWEVEVESLRSRGED
jgi:hypothetical protein